MALWWIVKEIEGEPHFFVQEATTQLYAGLRSAIAGFEGKLVEAHQLDAKTAKKVPKDLVGRVMSQKDAMRLLKRSG